MEVTTELFVDASEAAGGKLLRPKRRSRERAPPEERFNWQRRFDDDHFVAHGIECYWHPRSHTLEPEQPECLDRDPDGDGDDALLADDTSSVAESLDAENESGGAAAGGAGGAGPAASTELVVKPSAASTKPAMKNFVGKKGAAAAPLEPTPAPAPAPEPEPETLPNISSADVATVRATPRPADARARQWSWWLLATVMVHTGQNPVVVYGALPASLPVAVAPTPTRSQHCVVTS